MLRIAVMVGMVATAWLANAPVAAQRPRPGFSVMTYNVGGLPWPVRRDRAEAEQQIGARLRRLRERDAQPHILVLQEAFTPSAKAIAVQAGYRYIADGPSRNDRGAAATAPADKQFAGGASALAGETEGKWADSGLRVASDYPIRAVRRMPFPDYACAGLDCLANKGALAVFVQVPGVAQPVAIVATHLNSRKAAGVPFARSLYAYRRQVDALGAFIAAVVPRSLPVVIAGDFNAGHRFDRRSYLVQSAAKWRPDAGISVAMDDCLASPACVKANEADIRFSYRRGRDWQFFSPGKSVALRVAGLAAVFGHDAAGAMLSDHVGYMAAYHIAPSAPALLTRLAAR